MKHRQADENSEYTADQTHTPTDSLAWMDAELDELQARQQVRSLRETAVTAAGWLDVEGKRLLHLASNDYLGLSMAENDWPEPSPAARLLGSGASRLITGHYPAYARLEEEFAAFKQAEACLVFSSGYMANIGVISSLVGRNDEVFSDRYNHASIVDGMLLSRAKLHRYKHGDMNHLESLLKKANPNGKKLIVSDSIFSMDGTMVPLKELVELKHRYGAMLMIDEAHSSGLYGPEGAGLIHEMGLQDDIEIQMGTFSKAYGGYGAYITGSRRLIRYLTNHARSLIYTTALPPVVVEMNRYNVRRSRQEPWRRERLNELSGWFRHQLKGMGFDTGNSVCQIIPVMTGSNEKALQFSRELHQRGIAGVAIRPPTVPAGSARIRFTLTAVHERADLTWALEQMEEAGHACGLISSQTDRADHV
ncbi:8-amino-7-oxononanoate synthase [Marinicrinis sediminis]|uniref:8-amino-7-ketopelargonate synthase n=1 Tax=Marinicrinis sediminis TaxID=1652465 RepID=A0ABW5RGI4_9BACL